MLTCSGSPSADPSREGEQRRGLLTDFDCASLEANGVRVADCRFPAWSAGDYVCVSEPSSIGLSFTKQVCSVAVEGVSSERTVAAGAAGAVGSEKLEWLRVGTPSRQIEITAEAWLREEIAEELGVFAHRDLAELSLGADPVIWGLGARLRSAARGGDPLEPIEVEALARRLYRHVFETAFGGRGRERGAGQLDQRRLNRVICFVEDHMAEPFGLTELAREAALSPFHFVRSFGRTVGVTPHRYVVMRRVERAHQLLATSASGLKEVSRAVGYSSPSHLRAAIRRHIGS